MTRKIISAIDGPFILSLSDPLASGGSDDPLIITSTGTIISTGEGIDGIDGAAGTAWTILNQGVVASSGGSAISLAGDGVIFNSGTISSIGSGIDIGGFGIVTNSGAIRGFVGVEIGGFGVVTNAGSITGDIEINGGGLVTNQGVLSYSASNVIDIAGGYGTVINQGTIGAYGTAVSLADGGTVVNGKGGLIVCPRVGVSIAGGGVIENQGTIQGGEFAAVIIAGGGVVDNWGTISDGFSAIQITSGSGTIENHGTIVDRAGPSYSSVLFEPGTTNNLLVIDPGAVFIGTVGAPSGSNSAIELTGGLGAINGVGTGQFDGFDTLSADFGANWTLNGPNMIGTVLNDGSLNVSGSLDIATAIDPHSAGLFSLVSASTLEVAAALGIATKMSFSAGSELVVDNFALFGQHVGTSHYTGSLLENFGGATIDLDGFGIAGLNASFSTSTGLLQLTNSAAQAATLDFQKSSLGAGTFHFASDGGAGILITHS